MRRLLTLFAVLVSALSLTSYAAACVSAGHGVGQNCTFDGPYQHCWAGKQRETPYITSGGSKHYQLDVIASIQPINVWTLYPGCANSVSAWVMFNGIANNYFQVGYVYNCETGVIKYFQEYSDSPGTFHRAYLWAWPGDGAHSFQVHRDAGTNTFHSYIDGGAFFAPVTIPNSYYYEEVMSENITPNTPNAPCNHARWRFGAYDVAIPGQGAYGFPWLENPPRADPGLRHIDLSDTPGIDWFDDTDWAL